MRTSRTVKALKTTEMNTDIARRLLKLRKGMTVFCQGALADAIFFVSTGKVKITVISALGKEAELRVLGPDEFLGEECLVRGSLRRSTATCLEASTVVRIESQAMLQALHVYPELSRKFVATLLTRRINLERDFARCAFQQ